MSYVIQELCAEIGDLKQALAEKDLALAQANRHKEELFAKVAEKDRLIESLKQEAQIHALEARTANRTIAEIYQVVSGKTGEPGNWHGAEPVKQLMGKAVRWASYIMTIDDRSWESYKEAELFLASPEVQAWKEQKS